MRYHLHLEVYENGTLMVREWSPDPTSLRKRANRIHRSSEAIQNDVEARLVEYTERKPLVDKYFEELG